MVSGLIPIKTPEGQAELTARTRRVGQRHRTVLFLVDGKRNADEVRAMAQKAGVPDHCFNELIELGMIMLSEPNFALASDAAVPGATPQQVDVPLPGPDSVGAAPDSVLPPSRSLFPESVSTDSMLGGVSTAQAWLSADGGDSPLVDDSVFIEARLMLVRAVRRQAPLAGAITLLKLRRARSRTDLIELLDEVEARISKPHRSLAATHTMRRVRQMLEGRADSMLESA